MFSFVFSFFLFLELNLMRSEILLLFSIEWEKEGL